jgi:AcrR family transcriptional regulator
MAQLVDAMGIGGSPSIYAAFGSKEDLFREAVGLYVRSEAGAAWQVLEEIADVRSAMRTLFQNSIEAFVASAAPRGCLVVLGAGHLGGASETVRNLLRDERRRFRNRLVLRLSRAIEDGDIPSRLDPEALAECILAFFSGLAIEAVDGAPKAVLHASAELFCDRLFDA